MYYYEPDSFHMWSQQRPSATREALHYSSGNDNSEHHVLMGPTEQRLFATRARPPPQPPPRPLAPKPMRNGMDTGTDCRPTVAYLARNAQGHIGSTTSICQHGPNLPWPRLCPPLMMPKTRSTQTNMHCKSTRVPNCHTAPASNRLFTETEPGQLTRKWWDFRI